ncbi:hypothetical protein PTKIN_Ptkin18bG0053500 [Pterospermum kingtungense]
MGLSRPQGFEGQTSDGRNANMSVVGKNFLMKCFDRDPNQRWTASRLLCHPYMPQNHTLFLSIQQLLRDLSFSSSNFQEKKLLQSPPGLSESRCNLALLQSPPGFSRSSNNLALPKTRNLEELNMKMQSRRIDRRLHEQRGVTELCL